LDIFDQAGAMISHWLGQTPAADKESFLRQAAQALWLEERQQDFFIKLLGARKI